jgi:hypothetical protein
MCTAAAVGNTVSMATTRSRRRWAVRLSITRRGGWYNWGPISGDFERALAAQAGSAVIQPRVDGETRRGRDHVRVTVAMTIASADVAGALTEGADPDLPRIRPARRPGDYRERRQRRPARDSGSEVRPRTTRHRRERGTGRGTCDPKIPWFWVQSPHSRVASVQVAQTKPESMPLVMRRSGVRFPKAAPPGKRSLPGIWCRSTVSRPLLRRRRAK